jgi:hypothetical protein
MSDSNNPFSWNPINQAFIDKDDGQEGYGLTAFTIAGFGIPPEGSLIAYKQYAGYQIVGVFGSTNFLIQRIKSTLGCISPRTLQFCTGYGLIRFTHLGFSVFDGIGDKIIDEDIHPYIFPVNEFDYQDLTTVDFTWITVAWGTQTAVPAMYVAAMPLGNSGGALSRLFCYDLVLKAWTIINPQMRLGTIFQSITTMAVPITLLCSFNDGTFQRWQADDDLWDNSIDTPGPSVVNWSLKTPMVFNQREQGGRIFTRQVVIRGRFTDSNSTIAVSLDIQGEPLTPVNGYFQTLGTDGTFQYNVPVAETVTNVDAVISGTGAVELNSFLWQTEPEDASVPAIGP